VFPYKESRETSTKRVREDNEYASKVQEVENEPKKKVKEQELLKILARTL